MGHHKHNYIVVSNNNSQYIAKIYILIHLTLQQQSYGETISFAVPHQLQGREWERGFGGRGEWRQQWRRGVPYSSNGQRRVDSARFRKGMYWWTLSYIEAGQRHKYYTASMIVLQVGNVLRQN